MVKTATFLLHLDGEKGKKKLFVQWKILLGKVSKGDVQIQVFGYFQVTEHEVLLAESLFLCILKN